MNDSTTKFKFRIPCRLFQERFSVIIAFPSEKYFINHIAGCVFVSFFTIVTIVLNLATVITFFKSIQLRKKVSNFLILVQSAVDLCVGSVASSLYAANLADEIRGGGNCAIRYFRKRTVVLLLIFSMLTMMAMSIERYFGVVHPLFHLEKVTKKRILAPLGFAYFGSLLVFSAAIHTTGNPEFFGQIVIGLNVSSFAFVYTRIYFAASSRPIAQDSSQQERQLQRQLLKDVKLAKACFLVVLSSFACLAPTVLMKLSKLTRFDRVAVNVWILSLAMLNPLMNSLLFFWKNRLLRTEAKKTFALIFKMKEQK